VRAARTLACKSCILDGELIAIGEDGKASFRDLHERSHAQRALVVFDLLELDGDDLRRLPLAERRQRLAKLFPIDGPIALADAFDDPLALLATCEAQGLEGIVSKRLDLPYRSGSSRGEWIKVKTAAWRQANRERHVLFTVANSPPRDTSGQPEERSAAV
jgi:bifunctional non-homologous end joining protein LigD